MYDLKHLVSWGELAESSIEFPLISKRACGSTSQANTLSLNSVMLIKF